MVDPDVTLTDYLLAIECGVFVYLLYRNRGVRGPLRSWFLQFFGSIGLAALAGGTVHGFFSEAGSRGQAVLWPMMMLAIGLAAVAAWSIGARLLLSEVGARRVEIAATLQFLIYAVIILLATPSYRFAIANYIPAGLFLLIVLLILHRRVKRLEVLVTAGGLILSFIAAAVQVGGVGLHPDYFDHNALYHLLEVVALFMIFRGAHPYLFEASSS
jgi:hypothetical protein